MNIDDFSPQTGRKLKEDNKFINIADIYAVVYDAVKGVLKVGSNASEITASHMRPDDTIAYSAGDVVGTDYMTNELGENVASIFMFRYVASAGSSIIITNLKMRIDVGAIPGGMGGFRLHLYKDLPTAIADNSQYNLPGNDRYKYLDYIDIDTPNDLGDTLFVSVKNINLQLKLATGSTTLYGILETKSGYPPTNNTLKIISMNVVEV